MTPRDLLVGSRRRRFYVFAARTVVLLELHAGLVHATVDTGETYVLDQPIRTLAAQLAPYGFWRAHRDVVINLRALKEFERDERSRLVLTLRLGTVTRELTTSRPAAHRLRVALGLRAPGPGPAGARPAREDVTP